MGESFQKVPIHCLRGGLLLPWRLLYLCSQSTRTEKCRYGGLSVERGMIEVHREIKS